MCNVPKTWVPIFHTLEGFNKAHEIIWQEDETSEKVQGPYPEDPAGYPPHPDEFTDEEWRNVVVIPYNPVFPETTE